MDASCGVAPSCRADAADVALGALRHSADTYSRGPRLKLFALGGK